MIEYMVKVTSDYTISIFGDEHENIREVLYKHFPDKNLNLLKVIAKKDTKGNGVWQSV